MKKDSFNHLVPNFLIGLCQLSRQLRPESFRFHKELGYKLFAIEPSFKISKGARANPDAVLISESLRHTLVFEWTASSQLFPNKEEQIRKYALISRDDLVGSLGVPVKACDTFDIVLVVTEEASADFKKMLDQQRLTFPVLVFSKMGSEYRLKKAYNKFAESKTDAFFRKGVTTTAPPRGFVPFPLSNVSPEDVKPHIVAGLVSLLYKDIDTFSIDQLCKAYVPCWKVISVQKKREIRKATLEVVKKLYELPGIGPFLERVKAQCPTFQFANPQRLRKRVRMLRNSLRKFTTEGLDEGGQLQLEFPD